MTRPAPTCPACGRAAAWKAPDGKFGCDNCQQWVNGDARAVGLAGAPGPQVTQCALCFAGPVAVPSMLERQCHVCKKLLLACPKCGDAEIEVCGGAVELHAVPRLMQKPPPDGDRGLFFGFLVVVALLFVSGMQISSCCQGKYEARQEKKQLKRIAADILHVYFTNGLVDIDVDVAWRKGNRFILHARMSAKARGVRVAAAYLLVAFEVADLEEGLFTLYKPAARHLVTCKKSRCTQGQVDALRDSFPWKGGD